MGKRLARTVAPTVTRNPPRVPKKSSKAKIAPAKKVAIKKAAPKKAAPKKVKTIKAKPAPKKLAKAAKPKAVAVPKGYTPEEYEKFKDFKGQFDRKSNQ
jgi:hypothetical protein